MVDLVVVEVVEAVVGGGVVVVEVAAAETEPSPVSCRRWIATPFWPASLGSMKAASATVMTERPMANKSSIRPQCIVYDVGG